MCVCINYLFLFSTVCSVMPSALHQKYITSHMFVFCKSINIPLLGRKLTHSETNWSYLFAQPTAGASCHSHLANGSPVLDILTLFAPTQNKMQNIIQLKLDHELMPNQLSNCSQVLHKRSHYCFTENRHANSTLDVLCHYCNSKEKTAFLANISPVSISNILTYSQAVLLMIIYNCNEGGNFSSIIARLLIQLHNGSRYVELVSNH